MAAAAAEVAQRVSVVVLYFNFVKPKATLIVYSNWDRIMAYLLKIMVNR